LFLFQAPEEGYDPRKSKVSDSTTEKWNTIAISGDITEVPGIGPKAAEMLAFDESGRESEQIHNTHQLFGKYLMFRAEGTSSYLHNEKFWQWLKAKGIKAHRSAVVKSIAEKTATFFPDFYDANVYADDEEEEE
jgi:hypothetical protein